MSKKKLTGLMLTGVAVIAIGGTETVLPQVGIATAQAAKMKTQTVAEAKADLQNAVNYFKDIAAKNPKDSGLQEVYKGAQTSLKDDKATVDNLQSYSLALNQYREGYNSDGSIKKDSNDEEAAEAGDNKGGTGIEDDSSSTNPVADTQDAHEYEESTVQDENGGSHSTDSNTDSNGNSGSSTVNSSSTKPNSHSTSEFSKESVNAPGNAGTTTGSSNTSTPTTVAKSHSKKGNLPGTGEDSNQTVLLAIIGLLGILGLGGTALALWLRQRKHVNNE
ncbi:hypothetical protein ACFQ44_03640 [Levilactobacillus lanxiensis]|uniref:Gram-positive cocci surface proteins LPxTG domain-containing protein n=2 Tax=Levilactobacillus lanxiensis TaxID=2799568 RepID=A0ABW4CZP6_9LACO